MILSLIRAEKIHSQEELRERLKDVGIEVTQATLSRDLKVLGVVRVFNPRDGYYYSFPEKEERENLDFEDFIDGILDIQFSGNLVVIKTKLGHATGVAFEIDKLKIPEIIGTVGGDDTLLVVLKEGARREDILKRLYRVTKKDMAGHSNPGDR